MSSKIQWEIGRVKSLEERFDKRHVRGAGKEAEFEDRSTGWWLTLDNGITFGLGRLKPDVVIGDGVRIEFFKGGRDA